ncbi:hypothetical protein KSP40_PGU011145 [Platanthera guangdongensis]|uniref:Uncharacterized protein n=1 Tax=Platanthera guangdongensis TaxID=2320717 RepID=A0ABR2M5E5_9ASPA
MDPKASAKAKRSHTQHGRKSHPTPAASAQKKKAAQAGSDQNARRPHSQSLPSNWDRYDAGEVEDERAGGTTMAEGETAPKSRGASFAHLIEQARSQQHGTKAPAVVESLSFFDELTLDFMQGVSSTFTVRGKNHLSRCEDDNFVVDDDLTPSFECFHVSSLETTVDEVLAKGNCLIALKALPFVTAVPFLNLDFHALAAQLSKLKLSERLFIEADVLPEDLPCEDSKGISSSLQSDALGAFNVARVFDSLPHSSPTKDIILQTVDENINVFLHSNLSRIHSDQGNEQGTAGGDVQKSPGSIQDRPLRSSPPSEIFFPDSTPTNRKSNAKNAGSMNRNQTIEAELDSLLDHIDGSPVDRISDLKPQNLSFYQNSSIRDRVFSKNTAAALINDSIDVLLAETSSMPIMRKHAIAADQPLGADRPRLFTGSSSIDDVRADASVRLSDLGSGDVIDDFDSWIDTL